MRRVQKPTKQQVVTVFKHGPRPRKMCRVLVAGHHSLDTIKSEITEGLGIAARENVTLNTTGGNEIKSVYDILTVRNNIIIASFPGEFDRKVYTQKRQQPKGAYQRVPPPSYKLPAMSKSSTTRLPPISGGWDNSSDGRSSGSDIMQRRVGYERQMKREYNARHSNRMNKLSDESAMEVSDILYSHERQRRADHQIRLERRQKLALKHLHEQEHRLHQAYRPVEKVRQEKRYPKKLHDRRLPAGPEYHKDVVSLFTTPRSKLPKSLNKHSVLPSVRADKKHSDKPSSLIPTYSPARTKRDTHTKTKKDDKAKLSQIPVKAPIPSINKPKALLQPEIIRQAEAGSITPHSYSSTKRGISDYTPTPDPPVRLVPEVIRNPLTPAKRPSTPIAKPSSSSKLSITSGIDSLIEENREKSGPDEIHRVRTPKHNDDLGYDSPKPTPKHPKLSEDGPEEDIKMPAKLTQRDSGLADSIEPESTESRRQSVTPEVKMSSPEVVSDQEEETTMGTKLDPVTEETETESPPVAEVFKFKPMLEIFQPKSEALFDATFVLGHTLGDGNFAVVKTAINKKSKEKVAIKVIDKEKLRGKEGMMINEIKIMRTIDHNHCVKLYDIYESEPHIYLVTELVQDGDLFDCIVKNRCFPEHTVRGMMLDMVSALDYMHSRNIVHRDIKPENILVQKVSEKYRLKLADFGLSMVVREPIFTICGTPTYIAPEILVECGYGLEIDMWAIGVINYILLCGFPPFRSKNKDQEELFSLIMAGEFRFISPYWDKISYGAKDLITNLLQVVPEDRATSKQVLLHSWLAPREE